MELAKSCLLCQFCVDLNALELSSEAIGCGPSLEKEYKTEKLFYSENCFIVFILL